MEKRVVYILGAGFSQPLGLPVVRDFIPRAKDLYFGKPQDLPHFARVFQAFDQLAKIKHYFTSDQYDIEEVFSILEMEEQFRGSSLGEDFKTFIADVINEHTPEVLGEGSGWQRGALVDAKWRGYGAFVAAICRVRLGLTTGQGTAMSYRIDADNDAVHYDVVSLNYDCVLELAASNLNEAYRPSDDGGNGTLRLLRTPKELEGVGQSRHPVLAKLHGSADDKQIVPPTWRKAVNETIQAQWTAAREVLSKANEIRILGYSLPPADAYVRYLLKAAAANAPNLQQFTMITRDATGTVESRFEDFVVFPYRRFINADIAQYLLMISQNPSDDGSVTVRAKAVRAHTFDLERLHKAFVDGFS